MKMKFNEKMDKIEEMMKGMSIEGRVEEFLDYRGRKVRGCMSVWVGNEEDKKRLEVEIKGWDWLEKSNVFVGIRKF